MKRVTLVFGLLAGVTLALIQAVLISLCEKGSINLDNSDFIGYGGIVITLSMIFFGIKSYRDNYQNGVIKFGKGLQIGLLISLVASIICAIAGEIHYRTSADGEAALMDKYANHQINKLRERGASSAEIDRMAKQMANLKEMNNNFLFRFATSMVIVLPVGIVISFISAALLRKREFLPDLEPRPGFGP